MAVSVEREQSGPQLTEYTAADLMRSNPISVRDSATVAQAAALFIAHGFQAAPVINRAGRPVGVLSQMDILICLHERMSLPSATDNSQACNIQGASSATGSDRSCVRDIMTPAVFAIPPDYPAVRVLEDLLRLKVHQLYVVDASGILVGAVSCLDILRHLASSPVEIASPDQHGRREPGAGDPDTLGDK